VPLRTDVNVPVVMQFVSSIALAARQFDYDVLLITKDEGAEGLQRVVQGSMADAMIVMDVEAQDPRLEMLQGSGLPVVLIGWPDSPGDLSCIDLDFEDAAHRCVAHLTGLGHRTIALLGATPAVYERGTSYALRFRAGFQAAVEQSGIGGRAYAVGASHRDAEEAVDRLFADEPTVTGLVVHNEAALPGILAALQRSGRRVPEAVSVVALCPDDIAEAQAVAVDAVSIPAAEVGERALATAMRQIQGGQGTRELIAPRLTVRASSAPAGAPERG
jgi:DNA-binding LacI/PurR family transcriptional regulator